ncbi:MAG TPA: hypothetical protein VNS22_13475 [Geminicoccus sp.]|uniref:hypothetical protein n=1 Tax=Geminicoccus sp. TaxID=2024832 RepID=UPI002B6ADE9B|nr:hypothetical protein [Geminicoccus sp.]HWL69378.1 hypothetical protein [Geminicoccus sp.]
MDVINGTYEGIPYTIYLTHVGQGRWDWAYEVDGGPRVCNGQHLAATPTDAAKQATEFAHNSINALKRKRGKQ